MYVRHYTLFIDILQNNGKNLSAQISNQHMHAHSNLLILSYLSIFTETVSHHIEYEGAAAAIAIAIA